MSIIQIAAKFPVLEISLSTFLANIPIIAHFKNVIFVKVGKLDFREEQAKK